MNDARNKFDAAKSDLQTVICREILWPARDAGLKPDEAAIDLYYYDVGPKSAIRVNDKFAALPEPLRTQTLALAVARVVSTGIAADIESNATAARKAARSSDDDGSYRYPTQPESLATPVWRANIKVGDHFLVRYGNGTQLVHVFAESPNRLCVRRLYSRGTKWANWRSSSIKRTDARILGPSRPVADDPIA